MGVHAGVNGTRINTLPQAQAVSQKGGGRGSHVDQHSSCFQDLQVGNSLALQQETQ